MGSYSSSVRQAFDRPGSLLFSCQCWRVGRERGYDDSFTPYMWLSSIALLPWLLGFPPRAFSTTISSLTSPQSLHGQQQPSPWECATIPKLQLPAAAPSRRPVFLSEVCMAAARTVWFSFHLGCHRSAVSLSALNVSPLTRTTVPLWGLDPSLLQFPLPPRAGPVLLTLLFSPLVPSSYRVLHGSIYSFPLVRYSCLLSAGVLHALLCLKVYSWCIRGERCLHLLLSHLVLSLCPLFDWVVCFSGIEWHELLVYFGD